jgi:hypothetical protein
MIIYKNQINRQIRHLTHNSYKLFRNNANLVVLDIDRIWSHSISIYITCLDGLWDSEVDDGLGDST